MSQSRKVAGLASSVRSDLPSGRNATTVAAPPMTETLRAAQDRVDEPFRRDVVEPNPAVPVNVLDGPRQEPAIRARHDSPLDPPGDAARGFLAGRVPEVEVAVLVGGEQAAGRRR